MSIHWACVPRVGVAPSLPLELILSLAEGIWSREHSGLEEALEWKSEDMDSPHTHLTDQLWDLLRQSTFNLKFLICKITRSLNISLWILFCSSILIPFCYVNFLVRSELLILSLFKENRGASLVTFNIRLYIGPFNWHYDWEGKFQLGGKVFVIWTK